MGGMLERVSDIVPSITRPTAIVYAVEHMYPARQHPTLYRITQFKLVGVADRSGISNPQSLIETLRKLFRKGFAIESDLGDAVLIWEAEQQATAQPKVLSPGRVEVRDKSGHKIYRVLTPLEQFAIQI